MALMFTFVYLYLSAIAFCNGSPTKTPENFREVGDYFISTVEADWFTAYETCRRNRMFLVSVLTSEDNNKIQVAAEDIGLRQIRFWTSGNDMGHLGDFFWYSRGTKLNEQLYHNWDPVNNAVNATEESCIDIGINESTFTFTWKKQHCNQPQLYMCQEALCRKEEEKSIVPEGLKAVGDLYLSTFGTDWFTAFNFCRRNGMLLVSIEKEQTNRDIQTAAENEDLRETRFWTSASDQGHEGKFIWLSSGTAIDNQVYINWNETQPDNGVNTEYVENCLEVGLRVVGGEYTNTFNWNDYDCTFPNFIRFVCVETEC